MRRTSRVTAALAALSAALLLLSGGCTTHNGFGKHVDVRVVDAANNPIPDAEVDISWRHGNPFWPKVAHEVFMTDKDGRVDQVFWHGSFHYVRTVQKHGYKVDYELSPVFNVPPEQQTSSRDKPIIVKMQKVE
jgi:hypothetical protein